MFRHVKRILIVTLSILMMLSFSLDSILLPLSQVEKAFAGGSDSKTEEIIEVKKDYTVEDFDQYAGSVSANTVSNMVSSVFDNKTYAMVVKTGYTPGVAVRQMFIKYVPKEYANTNKYTEAEREKHAHYRRIEPSFVANSMNYRIDNAYAEEIKNEKKSGDAGYSDSIQLAQTLMNLASTRRKTESRYMGSYLELQSNVSLSKKSQDSINLGRKLFTQDYKFNPSVESIKASLTPKQASNTDVIAYVNEYASATNEYDEAIKSANELTEKKAESRKIDQAYVKAREATKKKQTALKKLEEKKREINHEATGRSYLSSDVTRSVKEYGLLDDPFASESTTTIFFNFNCDQFEILDISLLMKEADTGNGKMDYWSVYAWDIYEVTDEGNTELMMYSNVSDAAIVQFKGKRLYTYFSENLDGLSTSGIGLLQDNDGDNINLLRLPIWGEGVEMYTAGNIQAAVDPNTGQAEESRLQGSKSVILKEKLKDNVSDATQKLVDAGLTGDSSLYDQVEDLLSSNDYLEPMVAAGSITETLYSSNPKDFPRFVKIVPEDGKTSLSDEYIVKDDDWYTIELSIPDLYAAGLEELNKWPLEPSLELMEYVYAEVNYYNGTEFDDTSRLNTVSIPVITNSILKIGTDNNNQFYDKLESDMLNGRIFSFAQQGDKLCFDVLLPGCVSIDSVKFSYESTINNNADDYFYLNTVKIYRKKDVTNVDTYSSAPFLTSKLSAVAKPVFSYHSTSYAGHTVYVDSPEEIEMLESGSFEYPVQEHEDEYLVTIETSNAESAATQGEVRFSLNYIDTKEKNKTSPEYILSTAIQDYYGYWIGETEGTQDDPDSFQRVDAAFRVGTKPGGTFCMLIKAEHVSQFTGFTVSMEDTETDDWQIESIAISRVNSCSERIPKTLVQMQENYRPGDDYGDKTEEINGVSIDRYYVRNVTGDPLISSADGESGAHIKVLVQPGTSRTYLFDKPSEQKEYVQERDYHDYEQFMDYDTACSDLKFLSKEKRYVVKVSVPDNSTMQVKDDGCGSRNLFYFQLVFENGESGFVLANSQMTTDGFVAGATSTFSIYTNQDMGDVVSVNVIPDDLDTKSDILDKLYIDSIEIIKENANGIARRYACSEVGWIEREYHSNDETLLKGQLVGRSREELICRYAVTEASWVLKYEFAISTGVTINTKYPQYDGPLKADITYRTSSGQLKVERDFDVAAAMYEYCNKSPNTDGEGRIVIDPERMLRPEHTDRFFISISDAVSLENIKFIAEAKENANWTISGISVSIVKTNSILMINDNDEYQMKYEPTKDKEGNDIPEPTLLVDSITNVNMPCLFSIYKDVTNTKKFVFDENEVPLIDEYGSVNTVISREPTSKDDSFNVYIFLTKSTQQKNYVDPIQQTGIKVYAQVAYTGQYNDYRLKLGEQDTPIYGVYDPYKSLANDPDRQIIMYSLGAQAPQFKNLKSVSVGISNSGYSMPVDYVIVQHIRGDVVCNTYYVPFNKQDPSLLPNLSITSNMVTGLESGAESEEVELSLGTGTLVQDITPVENDLAVAVKFESFTLCPTNQNEYKKYQKATTDPNQNTSYPEPTVKTYYSPYVFLSDGTDDSGNTNNTNMAPGQSKKFIFNVACATKITDVKVVTTGTAKAFINSGYVTLKDVSGNTVSTYGLNIGTKGLVPTGGITYKTKDNVKMSPVEIDFLTSAAKSQANVDTLDPVELTVNYLKYTNKEARAAEPATFTIESITGDGFRAGEWKHVSFMLEDLKEIRSIQVTPTKGGLSLDEVKVKYKPLDETAKKFADVYTTVDKKIDMDIIGRDEGLTDELKQTNGLINLSDITVLVNCLRTADGKDNRTTENGNLNYAVDPGEAITINIKVKNQLTVNAGFTYKIETVLNGAKSFYAEKIVDGDGAKIEFIPPDRSDSVDKTKDLVYLITVSSKECPSVYSTVTVNVRGEKADPIQIEQTINYNTYNENNYTGGDIPETATEENTKVDDVTEKPGDGGSSGGSEKTNDTIKSGGNKIPVARQ